jgi:hypothetical protein
VCYGLEPNSPLLLSMNTVHPGRPETQHAEAVEADEHGAALDAATCAMVGATLTPLAALEPNSLVSLSMVLAVFTGIIC